MSHLYEVLATKTQEWRAAGHPCDNHPVIGEILEWQIDPETGGLRYLRTPQCLLSWVLSGYDRIESADDFVRGVEDG